MCCQYSLEAPHWGAANEYPQHIFSWRNKKHISSFWLKKKMHYLELQSEQLYLMELFVKSAVS